MRNIIILLLLIYGCSSPIEIDFEIEPQGTDVLMSNPIGVQVYFNLAEGSSLVDSVINTKLYNNNDSLLDYEIRTLSGGIDGYILGYIYSDIKELDTINFKLSPSIEHPDLTFSLVIRTYNNVSEPLEFNNESHFRIVVPMIGESNNPIQIGGI